MSEGKFYTIALLVFASLVMFVLLLFDYLQPEGMNWELVKECLKIVGMIVPALLILMNMNAGRRQSDEKLDDAAEKAKMAARIAAIAPDVTAAKVTGQTLPPSIAYEKEQIESKLAEPKEKGSHS